MSRKKKIGYILLLLLAIIGIYGGIQYYQFLQPPSSRLAAGAFYPEMPPDDRHIYIQLPLDPSQPQLGTFTDYYILSPGFKKGKPVVFQLYDNQQERVSPFSDSAAFDTYDEVTGKNMSYVLIGNRGVPPTLFPEIFDKNGKPDLKKAMQLYGSAAQVEDIEAIRLDMLQKRLLPADGKIMLMGGSGGGFLIQQYISKYGQHVSRALIESSSAPDLCQKQQVPFALSFYATNPEGARLYHELYQKGSTGPGLNWLLFKTGLEGDTALQNSILRKESNWINLLKFKKRFSLQNNSFIIRSAFESPKVLEVKVRIWELIGNDLVHYAPQKKEDHNLMYASMLLFLKDFIAAYKENQLPLSGFQINRKEYAGELMIWSNKTDPDFGAARGLLIHNEYPQSKLLLFNDSTHRIHKTDWHYELLRSFFANGIQSDGFRNTLQQKDSSYLSIY